MSSQAIPTSRLISSALLISLLLSLLPISTSGQNTVTGAFEGVVTNSLTKEPISGAIIRFTNQLTGIPAARRSDAQGRFYQGLLSPGIYRVEVTVPGFKPFQSVQRVLATQTETVQPLPIPLEPEIASSATPTPTPTEQVQTAEVRNEPQGSQAGKKAVATKTPEPPEPPSVGINVTDARRAGAFTEREVSTLPLGSATLVRTFDELALLLPGVGLPPQTQGNVAGPGVGAGVGSAGQFAVNGLRSRANNFTVDGSDNNDEDIGVRRQGFLALVPQPIESIQEYQVITLLAPAEYGRNIGAQVNAVSKSGGNETHGTIFGLFNSSQLNARNFFDSVSGSASVPLQGRVQNPDGSFRNVDVFVDNQRRFETNNSLGEDSFTLAQGGLAFGGPLMPETSAKPGKSMFYFFSAEGQLLNAAKEANFAVPTVEERGVFGSGATGFDLGDGRSGFPTSIQGDAIFSLFPFPNNPNGVYGRNTFTQTLPAGGQGKILSGKFDGNFRVNEKQQTLTARYNFTDDWRDIPVTGDALFSRLRPRVRTQNFSTFLNSDVTGPNSTSPILNQLRLSYGRTRLVFDEGRDMEFLTPSAFTGTGEELRPFGLMPFRPEEQSFLLNAPVRLNNTLPGATRADYLTGGTVEGQLTAFGGFTPVGQVVIAGFSPVGVDVFNFPQRRVNNTYQIADTMTLRTGDHHFAFGTDSRRTELNSALPRNSRPLFVFGGSPFLNVDVNTTTGATSNFRVQGFIDPTTLAAAAAPTSVFQTTGGDSAINLRYYQLDFFGQDEWRVRRNLSLSLGLRYEYNTPPREVNRRIERDFNSPDLSAPLVSGLRSFINGRTEIFDPDRNNIAPRVGFAYAPNLFGLDRPTVIRVGYGIFYDQILGAVVSQSRNVFPSFQTLNFAGGINFLNFPPGVRRFNIFTPTTARITCSGGPSVQFIVPGTLNTINPSVPPTCVAGANEGVFPGGFGLTLPARTLEMPMAQHYAVSFEQQVGRSAVVSAAYVGTQGRHLLRLTTPNLGPNVIVGTSFFDVDGSSQPAFSGFVFEPGSRISSDRTRIVGGRPTANAGSVNIYETSANSRYDALQLQVRGRLPRPLRFQVSYTFSKAEDDASDVFDLAGGSALPQNSLTRAGERGPSNFDVRHRISYDFNYDFPDFRGRKHAFRFLLGGLAVAGTGQFQTGQPFTVNSIFDVNLDGNLTDRLNTMNGLELTGDRHQPLRLTTDDTNSLLAAPFQDGSIGRNTFRAGNLLLVNLAVIKNFALTESQRISFRAEVFNLTNRANFGIPVRFLEAPGFGQATDTMTPGRRVQFALKYLF
jgi:Carboxypeptidase regulatory-like domain